ncbi:MFS transporter [uncultured Pseudokineococcus sp.]|uniref:MFS transporter n=1 Tax=uncultured Pseudokineococcus sp. TaxID=1642928 RepID=UPI00262D540D|nr:MFS transporter [uncultured Pseudokineococcus sp.]
MRGDGSYRALLALPGAAGFFFAANSGRVGVAATGLGLIWLITGSGGSFAVAGLVVGAFAAAEALVGPQVARLIDRWGQTRVLPWMLTVHAATVVATVAAVLAGSPVVVVVLAGAVAGASTPQLGALSTARWAALLGDRRGWLPRAFALESLANAVAFLLGPVLVSVAATTGPAWAGTAGAAVVVVIGGSALALQPRTAPPVATLITSSSTRSPRSSEAAAGHGLRSARFALLVTLTGVLGLHFGAVTLSMTAWATEQGSAAMATGLIGVSSAAGLVGAWAYGLRRWQAPPVVQLCCAAAVMALGCAGAAVVSGLDAHDAPLVARLVILGACIALTSVLVPVIIVQLTVLTEAGLARAVLTQALTWANSASAAGSAAAGALAGVLIDTTGARGGFALLTAVSTFLLLLALTSRRRLS